MTISMVFLLLALVCFIAGAANYPRVNAMSLGLAFYVMSLLIH